MPSVLLRPRQAAVGRAGAGAVPAGLAGAEGPAGLAVPAGLAGAEGPAGLAVPAGLAGAEGPAGLAAPAGLVLVGLVLAGCSGSSSRYGMPHPATRQGHSTLGLWQGLFITAAVVGAIVWALILWAAIRYRKRRGDDSLPKQTEYHIPLEITYTIIPVIIVAVIFGFVVKAENTIDRTSAPAAVSVRIEAFQWGWRFTYLNPDGTPAGTPIVGDQFSQPVLRLPAFETVRLTLVSDDVDHSFYVPNFLFKRDLIPGVNNTVELYIDQVGTFSGHCAEFCGLHHADMNFSVEAVPKDQFRLSSVAGGGG